jgi:glycosyltransferase involved in cell wall biosynthesis
MSSNVRATIVIASRDRPEELGRCLGSVMQCVTCEDEVIVVDSASDQPHIIRAIASKAGARLIRSELTGSARARNIGINHSRGRVIAFTDDDATVDPIWLRALLHRFYDPSVGAVVGPVFESGSNPPVLLQTFSGFDAATECMTFNRAQVDWYERARLGAIGSGANLAVRRDVFERVGLFRESLGKGAPISGDETYFLLSMIERGETVVNEPAARVYHPHQSPQRIKELVRLRAAYVLYVAANQPRLRAKLLKSVALKLFRGRNSNPESQLAKSSLLDSLCVAAVSFMEARRIDRANKLPHVAKSRWAPSNNHNISRVVISRKTLP